MTIAASSHKGAGMVFRLLLVALLIATMVVPVFATGGKSFDDALNIIGNDGKINSSSSIASTSTTGGLNGFIAKYKGLISGLCGVLTVTMIGFFALNITKLGASGDNEMNRKKAINGILFSAIAAVLFGGMSVFIGLFWNVLA